MKFTAKFTEKFADYACDGDTISCEVDGFDIVARIVHDDDATPPWDDDGHGSVSDWTTREKRSGERVLIKDRWSYRYYDAKEAILIAKRDGWDAPPLGEGTLGERAARAVEADFQAMRGWCNNDWWYCGIVLSISRNDVTLDDLAASLWRIDVNHPNGDNGYLIDAANELLPEAMTVGREILAKLIS